MFTLLIIFGLALSLLSLATLIGRGQVTSGSKSVLLSMLALCLVGTVIAKAMGEQFIVINATFTAYLLATTWLALVRGNAQPGPAERFLLIVPIAATYAALTQGLQGIGDPQVSISQILNMSLLASVSLLAAAGDWQVLNANNATASVSNARQMWRLYFSIYLMSVVTIELLGQFAQMNTVSLALAHVIEAAILLAAVYWLGRLWVLHIKRWRSAAMVPAGSLKA